MSKADIRPSFHWAWLVLLIVATILRGGFLIATPGALQSDPDGYRCLAENLVDRGVFGYRATPTAYRPPLYPFMLAPLTAMGDASTMAIGVLQVVLGVVTVAPVYRLAKAWNLGRFSIVAAVLVAVDPLLLKQSTLVMTETPAVLLAVVVLLALTTAANASHPLTAAVTGPPWPWRRFAGRRSCLGWPFRLSCCRGSCAFGPIDCESSPPIAWQPRSYSRRGW